MLALGLTLASDVLDAPVPNHVQAWVRSDPAVDPLARDALSNAFATDRGSLAQDNLFYLRAMTSPTRRLRYVVHLLTVPTLEDLEDVALAGPLALLYYPLRPLRLLGQALRLVRGRARR